MKQLTALQCLCALVVPILSLIAVGGMPRSAPADQPAAPSDANLQPAAAELARLPDPAESIDAGDVRGATVHFMQRPSRQGDRVVQDIDVRMTIDTRITQSGQTAHQSTEELWRRQRRVIDALKVVDGRAVKVRASFPVSQRRVPQETPGATPMQVIEGKAYVAVRDGDELKVTDLAGAIPPLDEFKLVSESLENVGKPNPLAKLLAGRTVAVGERIRVPGEMVKPLLGLGDQVGEVKRFELTLIATTTPPGGGVFRARIEVFPDAHSPLMMTVEGKLVVETDSCRLLVADFAGPLNYSSVERTAGGMFHYSASGHVAIVARSQYAIATTRNR